jgi:short-subunit dehydrogenase
MEEHKRGTALITGASSGIGAEFARQLAARGHNLILTARREARLRELSQQLEHAYGIRADVLPADLSIPRGVEAVERAAHDTEDLLFLINDAGFGLRGTFKRGDLNKHLDMIRVHVIAPVRLMKAALPGMLARAQGALINVTSVSAFVPLPGNTTYSASKSFLYSFSKALAFELRGSGVQVQVLCPGYTRTGFHSTAEYEGIDVRKSLPAFLWKDADAVVASSLRALARGKFHCVPGTLNRIFVAMGRMGLASLLVGAYLSRVRR